MSKTINWLPKSSLSAPVRGDYIFVDLPKYIQQKEGEHADIHFTLLSAFPLGKPRFWELGGSQLMNAEPAPVLFRQTFPDDRLGKNEIRHDFIHWMNCLNKVIDNGGAYTDKQASNFLQNIRLALSLDDFGQIFGHSYTEQYAYSFQKRHNMIISTFLWGH
ncbi:hypothetical protein JW935_21265 [candidate division KSB1 bacterium]|nr:hypothetical protein [candidate division KSB1 bacterium]